MINIKNFLENGYYVSNFQSAKLIDSFEKKIKEKVSNRLKKIKKKITHLDQLHKLNLTDSEQMFIFDSNFRNIKFSKSDIREIFKNNYLKAIFEHYYGNKKPHILYTLKERIKNNLSGFRVVSPNSNRVAKVHCESSYGIHCLTIWVPIKGFSNKCSLKIYPKSHMYRHENKHIKYSGKFNKAQLFKEEYLKKFTQTKRINFKKGQFLIFHPDLLHGGSKNNTSKVRVSMEFRIYSNKNVSALPQKREIDLSNL